MPLLATSIERLLATLLWAWPGGRAEPTPSVAEPDEPAGELRSGLPRGAEAVAYRLRDEVVMPRIQSGQALGSTALVDIRRLVPWYKFAPRRQLLTLMEEGLGAVLRSFRRTEYYRDQASRHGAWVACLKVVRSARLLSSMRCRGFDCDLGSRRNLPVILRAANVEFRLDGTHRASVARHLGYPDLPTVVLTPRDLVGFGPLPGDVRAFVESLAEPEKGTHLSVSRNIGDDEIAALVASQPLWYQAIDFGAAPELRTYRPGLRRRLGALVGGCDRPPKNAAVQAALPNLTGKRVLDVGCNSGLYTCLAAMRGAREVVGIDQDARAVERARITVDVFRRLGRIRGEVGLVCHDIRAEPGIVRDFDVLMACAVLYHLGPLDGLVGEIRRSRISLLLVQANTDRAKLVGRKNRPGVEGYEAGEKTWGNVVGTLPGARRFVESCGFEVEHIQDPRGQYPVIVGRRSV